jgi:hypothetical protein
MYNNGRQRKEKKLGKTRKYTFRHVVAYDRKDVLEEEVRALSGAAPGTVAYFAKYQAGLKSVCDMLNEDEIEEYSKIAKEWNEEMPAKEVQQA